MHILALMAPIVFPILLGYCLLRLHIFTSAIAEALLKYLMYATFPAVIISNMVGKHFSDLFHLQYTVATIVGLLIMYISTYYLYRFFFQTTTPNNAMAALSTSFVSSGIVGLPIMVGIIGVERTVIPVIVSTMMSLIIVVPITVFLIKSHQKGADKKSFIGICDDTLIDVVKNPLVASSLIGMLIVLCGVHVPEALNETLKKIGDATFGTALVAIGAGINLQKLKQNIWEIALLSSLRLVLFAIVGFGLAIAFKLPGALAVPFVMIMSLPTAKSVPSIGHEYKVFMSDSIQVVTVTTLSMIVVIPIVVFFATIFWPGIIL